MLGSAESEHPGLTNLKLIFWRIPICDHNTSTSRRDGQTTCRI